MTFTLIQKDRECCVKPSLRSARVLCTGFRWLDSLILQAWERNTVLLRTPELVWAALCLHLCNRVDSAELRQWQRPVALRDLKPGYPQRGAASKAHRKMAEAQPAASALVDGEVTLIYATRAADQADEDNGPLAASARRVFSVEVRLDDERRADVFFYDSLADAAAKIFAPGARVWLEAPQSWLVPAQPHPRMAADPLFMRRRAGCVGLAPLSVLQAARTPDTLQPWRCAVQANNEWKDVEQPPAKRQKREPIPHHVAYPSADRVDKDHVTLRGCARHCGAGMEANVLAAVYATKRAQRTPKTNFVTLELCDEDGAFTATLTAFGRAERLPTPARQGDALRCRRVVFEPPLDGDRPHHLRLRGVAYSGFAAFCGPDDLPRPGFLVSSASQAVAANYCGAAKPTPATAGLARCAARLLGATPVAQSDDDEAPCCLIDVLQSPRADDLFTCRCAVPAVRRDDATGQVLAARLVDGTAELEALVPDSVARFGPAAAGVATLRAQVIGVERHFILDAYAAQDEPFDEEWSQDEHDALYGATQPG